MTLDTPFEIRPAVRAVLSADPTVFIDAKRVATTGATLPVHDPATGRVIALAPDSDDATVDRAVRSARVAFEDGRWRDMRPADRERVLLRFADLVEHAVDELAQLETLEQGKSINIARMVEVPGAVEWMRFAAGLSTKITGQTMDVSLPGGPRRWTAYTRREAIGVVAAIAPWNFPILIAVWKIMPALAAGCSVVLKPSEVTPLTALRLAELAVEAGLPAGVFNVVTGRGAGCGRALVSHPFVAKIAFTGSTATGKAIGRAAMDGMKRVTLELGGKNPAIVLADADLGVVIPGLLAAGFLNGGQICAAASRVYVEAPIFDDLVAGLEAAIGDMNVGAGLDPAAQLTPLASAAHQAKVRAYLDDARTNSDVRLGVDIPEEGYFARPALVLNPDERLRLFREEVFGPILGITRVADAEDALARANASDLGLVASLWTRDLNSAMNLMRRIEAGVVWVNTHLQIDPVTPFGGYKQSGLGSEFGVNWLDAFLDTKSICIAH